jgi:Uma2 family endonuclease
VMRERDQLDLMIDPPPDVVIEVDITSSSTGRLPIYAELGVPEVWRCNGHSLKFNELADGAYREITESIALPGIKPASIMQIVDQRFDFGQTSLVKQFRDSIRASKAQ